jgi:hypothetical protein
MPSTDRKPELKEKASVAQTASQVAVYAKRLMFCRWALFERVSFLTKYLSYLVDKNRVFLAKI